MNKWKCRQCQEWTKDPKHTSFFTDQDICNKCREREAEIKKGIVDRDGLGADTLYKRCGYVPKIDIKKCTANQDSNIFSMNTNLHDEIKRYYFENTVNTFFFEFINIKIRIESSFKIKTELNEEGIINMLMDLSGVFLGVCQKHEIPYKLTDIEIVLNNKADQPLAILFPDKSGSWIVIPEHDFYWQFSFLHELVHCWVSLDIPSRCYKYKNTIILNVDEIFADILAICALRTILREENRMDILEEIMKNNTYVKNINIDFIQEACREPEKALREMLKILATKQD